MAELLLDARAVSKTYHRRAGVFQRDAGAIQAVDQVTLSLKAGDTLGLVGESGCGKTTLAKILVGLVAPTAGAVFIRGQSAAQTSKADRLSLKRAVQFVFQDPMNSLNPRMTVEETLGEPLAIHGLAHGDARRQRVRELLARVQLPTTHAGRLPRELSGGERQRVGLARALAVEPEVLICDEPIASLDVSVGAQILELLRGLCARQRTALLFISHDLRAVASLCHRVAVMKEGRLIESGPTDALLAHPRHPYTELLIRAATLELDAPPSA